MREAFHLVKIAVELRNRHHFRKRGKMIVFFGVDGLRRREIEGEQVEVALKRAEEILCNRRKADRLLSGLFVVV